MSEKAEPLAESVVWFQCPECTHIWSDGQSDPGRAWCCGCGTSASYPALIGEVSPMTADNARPVDPQNDDDVRPFSVIEALRVVHGDGWKTMREKSYYQAQERQRVAEALRKLEQEHNEHTRAWANRAFDEVRRLSDRCTYLYGLAASLGATEEQLLGAALIDGEVSP